MIHFLNNKNNKSNKNKRKIDVDLESSNEIAPEEIINPKFTDDFDENMEKFRTYLKDSSDAIIREFTLGINDIKCGMVGIDGLTDRTVQHQHVMIPLMQGVAQLEKPFQIEVTKDSAYNIVKERMLAVTEVKEAEDLDKALFFVMSGETALLIEGSNKVIIVNTRGWEHRGVQEPESETVIRGAREGFTETLRINTALLRRRCRDVNMVLKTFQVGRRSKTDVAIAYIKGIVNPEIVKEVEKRLSMIDTDKIMETGPIEHFIEDDTWSPFPQIQSTERPDKAVASIIEGRVIIIVDGTPFVLIVPSVFPQFLQSSEDYYERWYIGSLIRIFRWLGVFIAIFTPALYIAVTSFHPGMLPTNLALTIAASREKLPFPAIIEAGLMEITIELLREAGARLPKPIGQTIGIVGGIIIGDAAVRANIASPVLIIVVAVTAIASFVIPSYSLAISFRLLRFPMMILAAILGLYGVILGFLVIFVHAANLRSFGVDYAAPFMPFIPGDLKDVTIRAPEKFMKVRPKSINPVDLIRQSDGDDDGES